MAGLSDPELHHFAQERLLNQMNAQLTVVRGERDEAELECDRLRGGELGKWFQLFGGLVMGVGAIATRNAKYEIAGWSVFGCGALFQVAALVFPWLVPKHRH